MRVHGGLERPEMEWPHSLLGRERPFRKNKDRFSFLQRVLDLLLLPQAGLWVAAVKGKMAELAKECADERHVANFALGDEMVVHAESGHQDEHIGIAGVVGDEHTRVAGWPDARARRTCTRQPASARYTRSADEVMPAAARG